MVSIRIINTYIPPHKKSREVPQLLSGSLYYEYVLLSVTF